MIIAAGGTGLAPVKSIINRFYNNPSGIKSLTLLAGFKSPSDVLFREDLNTWKSGINVQITVDRDDTGQWKGRVGLITELIGGLPKMKPLPPTLRLEAGASCFIDRSLKGLTQSPQA